MTCSHQSSQRCEHTKHSSQSWVFLGVASLSWLSRSSSCCLCLALDGVVRDADGSEVGQVVSSTFGHVDDVVDLCRDVGASHSVDHYLTLVTCPLEDGVA